jgi:malic enzyme
MSTLRHVIFGTGATGLATMDALRRRGEAVRLVNRSGTAQRGAATHTRLYEPKPPHSPWSQWNLTDSCKGR